MNLVSVPSRGAIFLNKHYRHCMLVQSWFPSPLGELYFLIGMQEDMEMASRNGFRPLSGSYIS